MLIPVAFLRTLGAVVILEKLQITYIGQEQQSSTLVLPSYFASVGDRCARHGKLGRTVPGTATSCSSFASA